MANAKGWSIASTLWLACLGIGTCLSAENPLGFYVGAAAGRASISNSDILLYQSFFSPRVSRYSFRQHELGWKVDVGVRPVKWLGAEVEYLNYGHARVTASPADIQFRADSKVYGEAVFAVAHLPIPLPLFDLSVKAGPAHLTERTNAVDLHRLVCNPDRCTTLGGVPLTRNQTTIAYGVGVQTNLAALAVRLEYERASLDGGDPDLLSIGLTWTF